MAFKLSRLLPYLPAAGALVGAATNSSSVGGFIGESFSRLQQTFGPTPANQKAALLPSSGGGVGGSAQGQASGLGRYAVPIAIAVVVVLAMRGRR